MTYYAGKELADAFRTVRTNTIQAAEDIPEDKYSHQSGPGGRTIAQLLTHIAVTPRLPLHLHREAKLSTLEGFDFFTFMGGLAAEEQQPRSKAEIMALLRKEGEEFAGWLETLNDEVLGQRVTYPAGMTPPSKCRFEMIMSSKEHEMHHRGQLMLIQRQIGIIPHLTRRMNAMIEEMQKRQPAASASI